MICGDLGSIVIIFTVHYQMFSFWFLPLIVEVEEESSLLVVLGLLLAEGTSGGVVSGGRQGADALVELQRLHVGESSSEGGGGVVLGDLHPGHDGPLGDTGPGVSGAPRE